MGPKMEFKWSQDLEKESPELILEPMKASAKKCSKKGHGGLSETARYGPVRPGSRAWVALIKGKHKPESLIKRVRDREGIIRRPLVPEGTVADMLGAAFEGTYSGSVMSMPLRSLHAMQESAPE